MWADFQPHGLLVDYPEILRGCYCLGEVDRLPSCAAEVSSVHTLTVKHTVSKQRGHNGDTRGLEGHVARNFLKSVQDDIHLRRVEGKREVELDAPHILRFEGAPDPFHLRLGTADDDISRAIVARYLELCRPCLLLDLLQACSDRQHGMCAGAARFGDELGAFPDEEQRVGCGDHACCDERRVLAEAVADDEGGCHAEQFPEADECDLDHDYAELRGDGGAFLVCAAVDDGNHRGESKALD